MSGISPASVLYSSDGYELASINGNAIPANTRGLLVEGTDGTNSRFISVDSSGRQVVVGPGTAGTASGGVLSVQGIAGMTALTVNNATAANLLANVGGLAAAGSASSGNPLWMAGSVTTAAPTYSNATVNALSLDTSGNLRTLASQSGTWTVQPGNTANTTPWLFSVNQGGNTAVVKNTAPLSSDQALVVALSPNSSLTVNSDGYVTTAAPTYTTGTTNYLSLDTAGNLRVLTQQGTSPWVSNISQFGGSNVVTGTGASGAGIPRVTVSNDSAVGIIQGGNTAVVKAASTAAAAADPALVVSLSPNSPASGAVTTAAPTYTTGTTNALSLTTAGALRVDGSAITQPVSIAGTVSVTQSKSSTGTLTSVNAANTSTTLLASNANRLGAIFYNDSSNKLYLGLTSSAVSTSSYTVQLMPNSYWEMPIDYTGQINGIWNGTNGAVRVTELT